MQIFEVAFPDTPHLSAGFIRAALAVSGNRPSYVVRKSADPVVEVFEPVHDAEEGAVLVG